MTVVVGLLAATTVAASGAAQDAPALTLDVVARALQPGEVVRLDVTCRCGAAPPRVTLSGGDVLVFPVSSETGTTAWQGLVGLDLNTLPGVYPLSVQASEPNVAPQALDLTIVAKAFASRRLRVAPAFVEPLAADLERISREAAAVDALFGRVTPRLWDAPFVAPVTTRALRNFGARSMFNGQARAPHGGVDFSGPVGTPVVAPATGRIALAGDLFFTGRTLVIDHGGGVFSLLAHLSTTTVTEGDEVERGALVGRIGATGRVTGPHLHWAIRLNGARVDPLSLLFATQPSKAIQPQASTGQALSR